MSVLAPPPSPTPSSFDAMLSDSDMNIDRPITTLKRKERSPHQEPSSSDVENLPRAATGKANNMIVAVPVKVAPPKSPKATAQVLVEIKNGKLVMKQKNLNWALTMPVMKAVIDFQTFLAPLEKLEEIPRDRLHVIAKLAQESDKSLSELTKVVRSALMPEADLGSSESDSAALPSISNKNKLASITVQNAILAVATRKNYGIDARSIASDSSTLSAEQAVPASLQLWRWEVTDTSMLPTENLDKALMRRKEREEAGTQAQLIFASLPEAERQALLSKGPKSKISTGSAKTSTFLSSTALGSSASQSIEIVDEQDRGSDADSERDPKSGPSTPAPAKKRKVSSASSTPKPKASTNRPSDSSPSDKRKRKEGAELSPEKLREREEKEAAKADRLKAKEAKRVEREAKELEKTKAKEAKEAEIKKAEERKQRQANFLTSFVKKAAAPNSSPSKAPTPAAAVESSSLSQIDTVSDFDKTFYPCQYKNLAPINRFHDASRANASLEHQDHLTREQMLFDFRSRCPTSRSKPARQRKGVHPPVSVREIKRIVTESDVLGGNAQECAEKALAVLQDQTKVQLKLLQFESDRRPGWYGTWTKSTNLIGPRCPLGQDPVSLDYSYDSDAEWEEAGQVEGEDVQDGDGEKEDSIADSDEDSEMDDWLVDDLEVEEEDERASARNTPQLPTSQPMEVDQDDIVEVDARGQPVERDMAVTGTNILIAKKKKKVKLLGRRFETKLVPFSAGPHWEESFGDCVYEHFSGYRIEFLNDACFGLDPFTFTSAIETEETAPPADEISTTKLAVRKAALPVGGVLSSLWAASAGEGEPTSAAPAVLQPSDTVSSTTFKHQLREDAIPHLLTAIEGSTKTRAGLVDDLKELLDRLGKSASKAALTERISAFAKKEKKSGSAWVIKDDVRARYTTL